MYAQPCWLFHDEFKLVANLSGFFLFSTQMQKGTRRPYESKLQRPSSNSKRREAAALGKRSKMHTRLLQPWRQAEETIFACIKHTKKEINTINELRLNKRLLNKPAAETRKLLPDATTHARTPAAARHCSSNTSSAAAAADFLLEVQQQQLGGYSSSKLLESPPLQLKSCCNGPSSSSAEE